MSLEAPHRAHIFIPYNAKIADINETDTNAHTLDLEAALSEPRKIIAVVLIPERIAGTGWLIMYPNGVVDGYVAMQAMDLGATGFLVIADGSQELLYAQLDANDDFDLYCLGYVVEI